MSIQIIQLTVSGTASPIRRTIPDGHKLMKCRIGPLGHAPDMAVLHRVEMQLIHNNRGQTTVSGIRSVFSKAGNRGVPYCFY